MKLNDQIQSTIKMFRDNLPEDLSNLIEIGAGEISSLPIKENSLKIGDEIDDFVLKDKQGLEKSLNGYTKNGPLILTFYRGAWCPYCNLQLSAYNKEINTFRDLGANLVALTPEGPEGKIALEYSDFPPETKESAVFDTAFDVLHDIENKIAQKFGLVFDLPNSHKKLFEMMNLDIEKANGEGSYTFSDPATYIIGSDNRVKWTFIPNNYRKRAEPNEIIEALKEIS